MSSYSIPIILGTTRKDNQSAKVSRYLQQELSKVDGIQAQILDLGLSDFPLLVDRVSEDNQITPMLAEWTSILKNANGVIIVSPEYKSGYPGSLKNFLDYLPAGIFRYKPVAISTVSSGIYAGTSCLQQLRQVVIGMAGLVIPDRFQVGSVQDAFTAENELISGQQKKVCTKFVLEMVNYTQSISKMQK